MKVRQKDKQIHRINGQINQLTDTASYRNILLKNVHFEKDAWQGRFSHLTLIITDFKVVEADEDDDDVDKGVVNGVVGGVVDEDVDEVDDVVEDIVVFLVVVVVVVVISEDEAGFDVN